MSKFAKKFIKARLAGFEKDMKICLAGVPKENHPDELTHAYFPALMACCGLLEYATCFFVGRETFQGRLPDLQRFARKYLSHGYSEDIIRVLHDLFRNSVAHRSIASGVWIDRRLGRRIVWRVDETADEPAIEIKEEEGCLTRDSPWPCAFSHRAHIHLRTLANDLKNAIEQYAVTLKGDEKLLEHFHACMKSMYPE